MISEKIVSLIKDNASLLTERLMEDLLSRQETRSYRNLDRAVLKNRVFDVYNWLDAWLQGDKAKGEIRNHYVEMGRQRFREDIPLEEAVMALMLIKRHLWLFVEEQNYSESSFMLHQALEFNNRVVLFFDRAIYFTVMGYQDELLKSIVDTREMLSKISLKRRHSLLEGEPTAQAGGREGGLGQTA
ncbi:MAG TPA: hypothetical protein PKM41_01680 [Deltaproteobacteria bacterium]|nr:hypothetical protein [Deltaproteobacteria bacterium]HOI07069.1 hypothetical protein [Deltaproteobacteria bacterium]